MSVATPQRSVLWREIGVGDPSHNSVIKQNGGRLRRLRGIGWPARFVTLNGAMKLATFNVNGVNGRLPVLLRWLAESEPDVVCLQELKAPDEKFPVAAIEE